MASGKEQGRNSKGGKSQGGAENRQYFRVNADLRLHMISASRGLKRAWVHSDRNRFSPLIGPPGEDLEQANERLREEPWRVVNLSAGGMRVGYRRTGEETHVPNVDPGQEVSIVMELDPSEEEERLLLHVRARVVRVDDTEKWRYIAVQYVQLPSAVERILSQTVLDEERRRLRGG
jgi:hypothetical protein